MFKLNFSKTFDNCVFTKYDIKPVQEDYFAVKQNVFCIADGVTRDLIDGSSTPYPQNRDEAEEIFKKYPNPSGAFDAAKICADSFVKYSSEYYKNEITTGEILEFVRKANHDILEINKDRDIDYLVNDLFCCVAVGGVIVENKLFCFAIGDCHVTLLDENLNQVFNTQNNHLDFENFEKEYLKDKGFDWDNPKDRILTRAAFRNNPLIKHNGKQVSFGVLSGEENSIHYVNVYEVPLDNVKYICAYSDGCEPNFLNADSIENLINNPDSIGKAGKEKTLIMYERVGK